MQKEVCSTQQEPQQAKRKAKPATNPDVHQTRQDCNCVLAIRMQRYTMYYYVVVMLLCCKWPLLAILQRLRVHWERKKMQQANYKRQHLAFLFYDQIYFGGAKDVFFFFLPSLFQKALVQYILWHTHARARALKFFFAAQILHIHNMYGAIWAQRNISFKHWNFKKSPNIYIERGQDSVNWINPE